MTKVKKQKKEEKRYLTQSSQRTRRKDKRRVSHKDTEITKKTKFKNKTKDNSIYPLCSCACPRRLLSGELRVRNLRIGERRKTKSEIAQPVWMELLNLFHQGRMFLDEKGKSVIFFSWLLSVQKPLDRRI